jgi:hypothetical protein
MRGRVRLPELAHGPLVAGGGALDEGGVVDHVVNHSGHRRCRGQGLPLPARGLVLTLQGHPAFTYAGVRPPRFSFTSGPTTAPPPVRRAALIGPATTDSPRRRRPRWDVRRAARDHRPHRAKGITAAAFPAPAVVVGRPASPCTSAATADSAGPAPARCGRPAETVYDVASLTKVVGVATAAMILFDEGKLDLDAPVQRYLPAFPGEQGSGHGPPPAHAPLRTAGRPHPVAHREHARAGQALVLDTPLAARPAVASSTPTSGPTSWLGHRGASAVSGSTHSCSGGSSRHSLCRHALQATGLVELAHRPHGRRVAPRLRATRRGARRERPRAGRHRGHAGCSALRPTSRCSRR